MNRSKWLATCVAVSAAAFSGISCNSDKKTQSESSSDAAQGVTTVAVEPGVAGGVIEDKITVSAKVTAIDKAGRRVTLVGPEGNMAMFTAGPEVINFDQIRNGDTVSATVIQRLVVFVQKEAGPPSAAYAAAVAAAPKGAKPGAIVAESYELVATVKAIDSTNRTATLLFSNGESKVVPVRPDVDLSRYSVGNSVVIRATTALKVLAKGS